ncbi:MAG: SDR family oxidoreductase [Candidatus Acidiferrales bacterium]
MPLRKRNVNMMRLDGKVAVITGASSGIGLATAQRFVAEGAFVFIVSRNRENLQAAARTLGENVVAIQGDVSSNADLDRIFKTVKETKGSIDILFANAGGAEFLPLPLVTEDHFDKIVNLNMRSVLFTVQKALPLLKDHASIIITGSIAGTKGLPGMSVYGAAKAALRSFVRIWASELKERGIRVNLLSPGPVDTPAVQKSTKEAIQQIVSKVPLNRIGKSEEIAGAAAFLASDDAGFVNGAELFADGGLAQV